MSRSGIHAYHRHFEETEERLKNNVGSIISLWNEYSIDRSWLYDVKAEGKLYPIDLTEARRVYRPEFNKFYKTTLKLEKKLQKKVKNGEISNLDKLINKANRLAKKVDEFLIADKNPPYKRVFTEQKLEELSESFPNIRTLRTNTDKRIQFLEAIQTGCKEFNRIANEYKRQNSI